MQDHKPSHLTRGSTAQQWVCLSGRCNSCTSCSSFETACFSRCPARWCIWTRTRHSALLRLSHEQCTLSAVWWVMAGFGSTAKSSSFSQSDILSHFSGITTIKWQENYTNYRKWSQIWHQIPPPCRRVQRSCYTDTWAAVISSSPHFPAWYSGIWSLGISLEWVIFNGRNEKLISIKISTNKRSLA